MDKKKVTMSDEVRTIEYTYQTFTLLKLANGYEFYKELVTKKNIGSVFYLLGYSRYPDYEDFVACNTDKQLNDLSFKNEYHGWLAAPEVNLLKVLDFMAYLTFSLDNQIKLCNSYLASKAITKEQIPMLVEELYGVEPSSPVDTKQYKLSELLSAENMILGDMIGKYLYDNTIDPKKAFDDDSGVEFKHSTKETLRTGWDTVPYYAEQNGWDFLDDIVVPIDKYVENFEGELVPFDAERIKKPAEDQKKGVENQIEAPKKEEKPKAKKEIKKDDPSVITIDAEAKVVKDEVKIPKYLTVNPSLRVKNEVLKGIVGRIHKLYLHIHDKKSAASFNDTMKMISNHFRNLFLRDIMDFKKGSEFIVLDMDTGTFFAFKANGSVNCWHSLGEAKNDIVASRKSLVQAGDQYEEMPEDVKEVLAS